MIRALTFAAIAAFATTAHAQVQVQVQPQPAVPIGDEYFAMQAYADGIAEVELSKLAMQRASEQSVKQFAEKMVKEHIECNNKIVAIARQKGIALPAAIDAVHSAAINRLATLSGSDFDKAYMMSQMGAHKGALMLFQHEAHKGQDADLKELAKKTVPTLEDHLKDAFETAGEKQEYEKIRKIEDYAKEVMKGDK